MIFKLSKMLKKMGKVKPMVIINNTNSIMIILPL